MEDTKGLRGRYQEPTNVSSISNKYTSINCRIMGGNQGHTAYQGRIQLVSTSYTSLPLELTCRKIIKDKYNRIIGYRLENKQNPKEIRDIKPEALENAIYNKQVVVDNIELLKNWGLVKKDKSTDNKQTVFVCWGITKGL